MWASLWARDESRVQGFHPRSFRLRQEREREREEELTSRESEIQTPQNFVPWNVNPRRSFRLRLELMRTAWHADHEDATVNGAPFTRIPHNKLQEISME